MQYRIANDEHVWLDSDWKEFRATVYFPVACSNTCPFCTSRALYSLYKQNPDSVLGALSMFENLALYTKAVVTITGGEPSEDLELLRHMLDKLTLTDVYLNSTVVRQNAQAFSDAVGHYNNIKGISVSRHCAVYEEDCALLHNIVTDDELTALFPDMNMRINVVLNNQLSASELYKLFSRWYPIWEKRNKQLDVSLRCDYNKVTQETLHLLDTPVIRTVMSVPGIEYVGHSLCDVCDNLKLTWNGMPVRFHRGLANTRLMTGPITSIESLVIFPDGFIATDWDRTTDGLEWYLEQLQKARLA